MKEGNKKMVPCPGIISRQNKFGSHIGKVGTRSSETTQWQKKQLGAKAIGIIRNLLWRGDKWKICLLKHNPSPIACQ